VRRVAFPFYALVLLTEIVWMAIVPLTPDYARAFALSRVQTGALLAAAGIATLVVALPVGLLSDRLGARRLVVASAAIVTASTLGQGLASDFWSLFLARLAFGVALGAVWTAGLAWFAEATASDDRPAALGFPMTIAGIGIVVGPAFAGLVSDATSVHVPFLVLAAAGGLLTVALARTPRESHAHWERPKLATTVVQARRDRALMASLVVMALIGVASGGVNLLVPLQLRADGLSTGATGLAMSGSSLVFVAASAVVSRRPGALRLRTVGAAALLYGVTMLLAVADTSAPSVIAFVLVRAPFWAALSTLAYPLGALGARRAGIGIGTVNGLLNVVWGAAGSAGPVAAGALVQATDPRWVFAMLACACAGVGASLLASPPDEQPAASSTAWGQTRG
jgi:MFS family permease